MGTEQFCTPNYNLMTNEESKRIKELFPHLNQDNLTRHENPDEDGKPNTYGKVGGWVHKNATVDPTASIHPTAFVLDRACVYDYADIGPHSIIRGDAVVEDFACVEHSVVTEFATVSGTAMVVNGSWLGGQNVVSGESLLDNVRGTGYSVIIDRELDNCKVHTRLDQCGLGTEPPDPEGFTVREVNYEVVVG